jgi:hypothetical protein
MALARILILLCLALLAPGYSLAAGATLAVGTALAADAPELRGPSTMVSGVYSVTFNLSLASRLPAGTIITCRARITPNPGGIDLRNSQPAVTPAAAAGHAAVNGSTATCVAEIPFAWTLASGQNGVMLNYEIDAVSSSGATQQLLSSSTGQSVGSAFPVAGANLSLNLAF